MTRVHQRLWGERKQKKNKFIGKKKATNPADMGLRRAFRKLCRFIHPQYRAMSPREIRRMDNAISDSMAKGSFGTTIPHRGAPGPATGEQLWSAPSSPSGWPDDDGGGDHHHHHHHHHQYQVGAVPDHLMSMSSHQSAGRVSVSSSKGHDSGYSEQYYYYHHNGYDNNYRPSSSRRQYYNNQQPPQKQQHSSFYYHQDPQHWQPQHEPYQPYEYDEGDDEQYPPFDHHHGQNQGEAYQRQQQQQPPGCPLGMDGFPQRPYVPADAAYDVVPVRG